MVSSPPTPHPPPPTPTATLSDCLALGLDSQPRRPCGKDQAKVLRTPSRPQSVEATAASIPLIKTVLLAESHKSPLV